MAKAIQRVIREMVKCPWKKKFVKADFCEWSCRYGQKGENVLAEERYILCFYNKKEVLSG